jgi:hypothetical protein
MSVYFSSALSGILVLDASALPSRVAIITAPPTQEVDNS